MRQALKHFTLVSKRFWGIWHKEDLIISSKELRIQQAGILLLNWLSFWSGQLSSGKINMV